jgi:hypothetical protein
MTQLSITVKNADLVRKGLQDLGAEIPKIGRLQIYRTAQAVVRTMKQYPQERLGQTYIRTYTLRDGWEIQTQSKGYTVRNDTPYTPYVVGDAFGGKQAWMHESTDQGKRWSLFRDVTEEEVAKLPDEIEKEISMVARRLGL